MAPFKLTITVAIGIIGVHKELNEYKREGKALKNVNIRKETVE